MEERCEIGWLSAFRVRAACEAIHGHDPEMEIFDQSPYHLNESGSKNGRALAVAGLEVPLVEGHGLFKSNADATATRQGIELRVREHIRSRGYGSWLTVATSPKGSYREADVLNFLGRHLPALTDGRHWRIMLADDFSAHLTPAVFRLCWLRGYVLIPLGGGVTGTQQTADLDLNQHVRREYCALEAESLMAPNAGWSRCSLQSP
jgi:hypothetical protein